MRLAGISLLVMFLSVLAIFLFVSPVLDNLQVDFDKGYAAYEDGNYETAIKWYRKAAEQGSVAAQY